MAPFGRVRGGFWRGLGFRHAGWRPMSEAIGPPGRRAVEQDTRKQISIRPIVASEPSMTSRGIDALYRDAQRLRIPKRSGMNEQELARAVRRAV